MPWVQVFQGFGQARQWVGAVPLTVGNQGFIFVFPQFPYESVRLFGVAGWKRVQAAPANFAPTLQQSIQVWHNPERWIIPTAAAEGFISVYLPAETSGLREVIILRFDP